jgi:opacity protein-like surface antigen
MAFRPALAVLLFLSANAFGQAFEASASFGRSLFGGSRFAGTIDQRPSSPRYEFSDGFHMALRMTINAYRFVGYEFGYAYNRTSIVIPSGTPDSRGAVTSQAQKVALPIHHGFGNVLLYATPEGTRVRPFVAGGGHFSSFFPPGSSVSYGNQTTKFGFNYGAGVKVRTMENWGFRVDARYYEGPKPFPTFNISGRLRQLELSAGISFFM